MKWKFTFSLNHNILRQSTFQMKSVSAAFKIPENIVDKILANVAALNKETWTQRIKPNGKGKIKLNHLSHTVQTLTTHIKEKGRLNRNSYSKYVEIYNTNPNKREEDIPIITGMVSYHHLVVNNDRNPRDDAKELIYILFEEDNPNTFALICNSYDWRESGFVFYHGTLYSNNTTYKITKQIDGFKMISSYDDEGEPNPEQDWFECFDSYTIR